MIWEEMTSDEFGRAVEETKGVCILPFGVIEKHGTHLPLNTDVVRARKIAIEVAKIEPAVVFPYYYFGQIAEARHVPGTISISPELMYSLLDNICREISRNGFKKIIILNTHGGNIEFTNYFCQSTLYEKRDYAVYNMFLSLAEEEKQEVYKMLGTTELGQHAGNMETSMMMAIAPELVKMDNVEEAGLKNYERLDHLKEIFKAIGWYADHPTHFAGEPFKASPEIGEKIIELMSRRIAKLVKKIKDDEETLRLQNEFYSKW